MFSNVIKLMNFLLAALTVLRAQLNFDTEDNGAKCVTPDGITV